MKELWKGERDFICPHEGCGKAFSLDFNLRSHMKTHSQKNYHICPYQECVKRYAHEYKLNNHIMSHHEKQANNNMVEIQVCANPRKTATEGAKSGGNRHLCHRDLRPAVRVSIRRM
ncbi:hypothetical protein L2E82_20787 [Cichorium intybus]|uniref:Uncharacterized protein n=1 Tax=Cichorium intybus TaxID=13427 RepID=A0ACB9DUS0_CICIN|nr:hypothetical protein L2E82_20787 [Cichorium intybus]